MVKAPLLLLSWLLSEICKAKSAIVIALLHPVKVVSALFVMWQNLDFVLEHLIYAAQLIQACF